MSRVRGRILLLGLLGLLAALPVAAQGSHDQDGYSVYYSVMPTLDLSPAVARSYAITRSANRALLNITVRLGAAPTAEAVAARIQGTVQNAAGQSLPLALRELREGASISYLAEPRMRPGDSLRFELQVQPDGAERPIALRFSRSFPP